MSLTIRQQLVPAENRKVLSGVNPINSITVHQTGNTNRGANAAAHANLQARGNPGRSASWQYQVDDKEAVQSYLDTDRCMHAGDGGKGPGNNTSIAVEICINSDGDYTKSVDNGARLVATLIKRHGLTIANAVQHRNWSGKNCPTQIRAGKNGITWNDFLALVTKYLGSAAKPAPAPKPDASKTVDQLAIEVMSGTWGNNPARRQALEAAGYDYAAVQKRVNELTAEAARGDAETSSREDATAKPATKTISQLADEVIAGKHGNGHANRQRSLGVSSTVYQQVRAEVNRRAGITTPAPKPKPTGKSISQMATEVLRGDHGNGHANRRKSLGVTNAVYQQVRAEVNRRAGITTPAPKPAVKPTTKSISQMATEVIAGKHGNGHANRRRSLGVSDAVYQQVRREVNRRFK